MRSSFLARALPVVACLIALAAVVPPTYGAAQRADADKLKTTLTPLGGERAGTADHQIPEWTGAVTPGFTYRSSPFDSEKPIATVNAANAQQYSDQLTDGLKALMQKHSDYKIVVYPSHRTAFAPQWLYDNTYQNAVNGKLDGFVPKNVFGGVAFPIPENGTEVMWNHLLRWRGPSFSWHILVYETTADGRHVEISDTRADQNLPFYFKGEGAKWNGDYEDIHVTNSGPPIRAGQQAVGRENVDPNKNFTWLYLIGQRRTRELPNACCDTPNPLAAGFMNFDELEGFYGELDRYDWKIVGKQVKFIPYNSNATNAVSNDLLMPHFLNPSRVRFEPHRVWVVEGTLRPGKRHQVPRLRAYVDEDSWEVVLTDRFDARNKLWKTGFTIPYFDPEQGVNMITFGQYDLEAGTWFVNGLTNQNGYGQTAATRFAEGEFTPEVMLRGAR